MFVINIHVAQDRPFNYHCMNQVIKTCWAIPTICKFQHISQIGAQNFHYNKGVIFSITSFLFMKMPYLGIKLAFHNNQMQIQDRRSVRILGGGVVFVPGTFNCITHIYIFSL